MTQSRKLDKNISVQNTYAHKLDTVKNNKNYWNITNA